jgi:NADPH:quinone reductase-like Zn-dependent oxidoreductase
MMQAYRFDGFNSLEDLKLYHEEIPKPQRGELLLRVHSVSLNFRDVAPVLGRYVQKSKPGLVPCSDAAAEVVEVGEGVTAYRVGERVISTFHPRWFGGPLPADWASESYGTWRDGWLTEYKVVSQEAVVALPDSLSYDEGATLPCAAATAWSALAGPATIRAGRTVLTLGTGGVSIFAVQLARVLGAQIIATTSNADKADRLRELGAHDIVNYSETPDWGTRVRQLTAGRGVDRVVEVGGPATINESLKAVAIGGEVVLIGFLSEENPGIDYFHLKGSGAVVRAISVGDRSALEDLCRTVQMTGIKPVIDRVFEFGNAKGAFEHLWSGRHIGKIVIKVTA